MGIAVGIALETVLGEIILPSLRVIDLGLALEQLAANGRRKAATQRKFWASQACLQVKVIVWALRSKAQKPYQTLPKQ